MKKSVSFSEAPPTIHYMCHWSYAYSQARRGDKWIQCAADRDRFRLRIRRTEQILNPVLKVEHRSKKFISLGLTV
ncbi:hypothetical protein DD592_27035 [Enterobacter cloacae complex sp. 2DZ2F20B]|nr:hypothetical protein DD592_27035 [Enterobacter cloacae complex sp. 2DZ2F20B]